MQPSPAPIFRLPPKENFLDISPHALGVDHGVA